MVLKTYYKPNRSKPRYFTACDAARIAEQVVNDQNLTPEQVLACIAGKLGFTHISMSRTDGFDVVQGNVSLSKTVSLIKTAVLFIQKVAEKLNIKLIVQKIGYIIELLDALERALDIFQPDQETVENIVNDSFCKCVNDKLKSGA